MAFFSDLLAGVACEYAQCSFPPLLKLTSHTPPQLHFFNTCNNKSKWCTFLSKVSNAKYFTCYNEMLRCSSLCHSQITTTSTHTHGNRGHLPYCSFAFHIIFCKAVEQPSTNYTHCLLDACMYIWFMPRLILGSS